MLVAVRPTRPIAARHCLIPDPGQLHPVEISLAEPAGIRVEIFLQRFPLDAVALGRTMAAPAVVAPPVAEVPHGVTAPAEGGKSAEDILAMIRSRQKA